MLVHTRLLVKLVATSCEYFRKESQTCETISIQLDDL